MEGYVILKHFLQVLAFYSFLLVFALFLSRGLTDLRWLVPVFRFLTARKTARENWYGPPESRELMWDQALGKLTGCEDDFACLVWGKALFVKKFSCLSPENVNKTPD